MENLRKKEEIHTSTQLLPINSVIAFSRHIFLFVPFSLAVCTEQFSKNHNLSESFSTIDSHKSSALSGHSN